MNTLYYVCCLLLLCSMQLGCSSVANSPANTAYSEQQTKKNTNMGSISNLPDTAEIEFQYMQFILAIQNNDASLAESSATTLLKYKLSTQMYIELASFYVLRGQPTEAKLVIEQAMSTYPTNFDLVLLWSDFAGDSQEIVRTVERFLSKNKKNTEARIKLYSVLYEQKRYRSILTFVENRPKKEQDHIDSFYVAMAWSMLGNTKNAIQYLQQALSQNPQFLEALFELGLIYEKQQNYTVAQKIYSEGIRKQPNSQAFWTRLITINLTLEQPQKALELVRQGPQNKSFLLSASGLFLEYTYYTQAEEILAILKQKYPTMQEVNFYYAFIYFERDKNISKALSYLKRIPVSNNLYAKAIQFEVNLYQINRQYRTAIEVAERARIAVPNTISLWDINAQSLLLAKEYTKAIAIYKEALSKWQNNTILLYGLAKTYALMGNTNEAMERMEQIIQIDNDHVLALNYIGYTLTVQGKQLSRAKILLEKALFLDSENIAVLDSLSWLYYKQRRYQDAWKLLQKAKNIGIEDPEVWEHYGDIATQLQYKKEARYAYKKVLEQKPKNDNVRKKLRALQ